MAYELVTLGDGGGWTSWLPAQRGDQSQSLSATLLLLFAPRILSSGHGIFDRVRACISWMILARLVSLHVVEWTLSLFHQDSIAWIDSILFLPFYSSLFLCYALRFLQRVLEAHIPRIEMFLDRYHCLI
jgi:hypothetical protein